MSLVNFLSSKFLKTVDTRKVFRTLQRYKCLNALEFNIQQSNNKLKVY